MRIIKNWLLALNLGASLLLLLSYFSASTSPSQFKLLPLLGLAYPYLFLVQLGFGFLWLFIKKRFALIALVSIAIGWPRPTHLLAVNLPEDETEESIKLLSYNIRLFNKYGWEPDTATGENVFNYIAQEQADILCFQEFYHIENIPKYRSLQRIKKEAKAPYVMFERKLHEDKTHKWRYFGLAIFSKFPIINQGTILAPNFGKAHAIFTDIVLPKDTVRVYNVHLKSLGFEKNEYAFINDIMGYTTENQIEQSKGIIQKLTYAFEKRSHEANMLKAHMRLSPYPVIVMGDFNEVPYTHAYNVISENMKDGFLERGFGMGATYGGFGSMPPIRIDYILADKAFHFETFNTDQMDLSDHEPISASVRLIQPE